VRPIAAAAILVAFSSSIAPDARTAPHAPVSRACGKIGPSLNLGVEVLDAGEGTGRAVIAVTASACFDAGETRFILMAPEGCEAPKADCEWSETLAAGCGTRREITLSTPAGWTGGVVAVRAEVAGMPLACEARAAVGTATRAADSGAGKDLDGRPALFTVVPGPAR